MVSPKEIAKDQGKPISKYERNMMIFDWLHTLGMMLNFSIEFIKWASTDESATATDANEAHDNENPDKVPSAASD